MAAENLKLPDYANLSSEILQILLDNSSDIIYVIDNDCNIVEANSVFISLVQADLQDQVIGASISELLPSVSVATRYENDRIALLSRKSKATETYSMPDGKPRKFDMCRVGFEGPPGQYYILGIGRDVTEQEEMIEILAKTGEELERFSFVASHDLQEPLRMIKSFTQLLQDQYRGKLDNQAQQFIQVTLDSVNHMQGLIDNLLVYCKLRNEWANVAEVDVKRILEYVLDNLEEPITLSNAIVTHNDLPVLQGNPLRLSRILQTLISNGLTYQAKCATPKIHVSAKDVDDMWLFEVTDNGIGVKPEHCEQIFQPFQRLHGRSTYPGFGIGLAVCRRAIERMGGQIWAESEYEVGTVMSFTVPKTPRPELAN